MRFHLDSGGHRWQHLASKVGSLFRGGQAATEVGTGLVDEAGNEITKQVLKEVPSKASQFAHDFAGHLVKHGMEYGKAAIYATALEEAIRRGIGEVFGGH